jgi:hypothetical protein
MSNISLRAVTFLNAVTAAGPSQAYALDYRYSSIQQRSILTACVAGDTINIEVSVDGGNSWGILAALAGPQATSITLVNGPFTNIRVNKVGANGSATVKGVV